MTRWMVGLLGGLTLTACEPSLPVVDFDFESLHPATPTFAPYARSGSRITYEGVRIAGFEYVVHTFDRTLGIPCEFQTTSDGVERCLPFHAPLSMMFTDPSCQDDVVWLGANFACEPPRYARQTHLDSGGCGHGSTVHALTPVPPPDVQLYALTADGCIHVGHAADQNWANEFYRSEPLPHDTFAASTLTEEYADDDIGVRVRSTADGSRHVIGPTDRRWGPVSLRQLRDFSERFTPQRAARIFGSAYVEPGCDGRVAAGDDYVCSTETPRFARTLDSRPSYFDLGPALSTVYQGTPETCMAFPVDEFQAFYQVIGPTDVTRFDLGGVSQVGDDVQLHLIQDREGAAVSFSGFTHADGSECLVVTEDGAAESNGDAWCVPVDDVLWMGENDLPFADANCQEPVAAVVPGIVGRRTRLVLIPEAGQCSALIRPDQVLGFDDVHTGPVWGNAGGTCHPLPYSPEVLYYRVSSGSLAPFPEIDWGEL